jgi:hypothetical protein
MNGLKLTRPVTKDSPLEIDDVDSPYSQNESLRKLIYSRGL